MGPKRNALLTAGAVCLALSLGTTGQALAAPAGGAAARAHTTSTGTVVVSKAGSSGVIRTVGTSSITIDPGATVQRVESQLVASDKSKQSYVVVDHNSKVKKKGVIQTGDELMVTAAGGLHRSAYQLQIFDPTAKARDGAYWNGAAYNKIDETVNANTPVFPDQQCNVTDAKYAGLVRQVTDGEGQSTQSLVWYYGDAINAAIADCHARGGGYVVVPAGGSRNADGAYYSGAITLLSNVNLRIDTGATVKFVRNPSNSYYPVVLTSYQGSDFYDYSPLVYALGQKNIAVTGGGTLDAQYNVSGSWVLPPGLPGAPAGTNTVIEDLDYEGVPVDQRIFTDDGHMPATIPVLNGSVVQNVAPPTDAVAYKTTFRPQFIEFNHSSNILIDGVHLVNTQFWNIHPLNSKNILIRNVNVYDTAHHTDDGIDPESDDNVVLENNSVTVLDDGVAIKSGKNRDGRELREPSQNIVIRNNEFANPNGGSASISIGSEMSGGVRNVFAEDNATSGDGISCVLKIKSNSYRGGVVQNIYVRNSTLDQTVRGLVNFDTNYNESVKYPNADNFNPTIRNIYLDSVNAAPSVSTSYPAFVISSAVSRSPIENVHYRNSIFYTTAPFESAFKSTSSKFFKKLVIQNVNFINPTTNAVTSYNTTPIGLLDKTDAQTGDGPVHLRAASVKSPNVISVVPGKTFTISGKINLATYPGFLVGGTVQVFVDRDATPVPVTVRQDGSFTSGVITLDDDQSWYIDRHYVAVNLANGVNLNTVVYQIAMKESAP